MDRPAKPPEKIALHAKMRCFTYSFAMTMTKVNCFHKYGSEKEKYVPSKTPKDNFSLIVDIEGKNGKRLHHVQLLSYNTGVEGGYQALKEGSMGFFLFH